MGGDGGKSVEEVVGIFDVRGKVSDNRLEVLVHEGRDSFSRSTVTSHNRASSIVGFMDFREHVEGRSAGCCWGEKSDGFR